MFIFDVRDSNTNEWKKFVIESDCTDVYEIVRSKPFILSLKDLDILKDDHHSLEILQEDWTCLFSRNGEKGFTIEETFDLSFVVEIERRWLYKE